MVDISPVFCAGFLGLSPFTTHDICDSQMLALRMPFCTIAMAVYQSWGHSKAAEAWSNRSITLRGYAFAIRLNKIYIYIRATPGFCPGVAAYISTIHKQMILQITVIPMGKITKVLGTIKQTRSKHPKFLWGKQKQHNIWNFYEKNRKGTRKF